MITLTSIRVACFAVCLGFLPSAWSQATPENVTPTPAPSDNNNSNFLQILGRNFVQESVNLGACKKGLKGVIGCGQTLLTGNPLHIVVGSLAPQNGVAGGLAFEDVYHPTYCASWLDGTPAPEPGTRNYCHWSLNMNATGEASGKASWRAGVYVTATHISTRKPRPGRSGGSRGVCGVPHSFSTPSTSVGFYSESDSLNRLYFYGLGPSSRSTDRAGFGLTENVTGVNAVVPVTGGWFRDCGITVLGEINGRFNSVRGTVGDTSPSIGTLYSEASAPGLTASPGYFQAGQGLRLIPPIPAKARLKLNYLVNFQEFVAPSATRYSFRRFTADLNHQFILYKKDGGKAPTPPPALSGKVVPSYPPISTTRDKTGSITARMLIQESVANASHVVPFFLDPTIGGSDINGQSLLASYPDYRLRAPNLLLIHGAFEQSLGRFPVGLFVGLDEGKVGLARDDISFNHLRHSYSAGITIHAGGLPVVYVVFAWGGNEGHHIMGKVDTSLLGPGSRPSLF